MPLSSDDDAHVDPPSPPFLSSHHHLQLIDPRHTSLPQPPSTPDSPHPWPRPRPPPRSRSRSTSVGHTDTDTDTDTDIDTDTDGREPSPPPPRCPHPSSAGRLKRARGIVEDGDDAESYANKRSASDEPEPVEEGASSCSPVDRRPPPLSPSLVSSSSSSLTSRPPSPTHRHRLAPSTMTNTASSPVTAPRARPDAESDRAVDSLMDDKFSLDDAAAVAHAQALPTPSSIGQSPSPSDRDRDRPPSYEPPASTGEPTVVPAPPAAEQLSLLEAVRALQPTPGQTWYLLSRAWYRRLQAALVGDPASKEEGNISMNDVGPIDNTDIAQDVGAESRLKADLMEGVDLEIVDLQAWLKLVSWYGCKGPVLPRAVLRIGAGGPCQVEFYPPVFTIFRALAPNQLPAPAREQSEARAAPTLSLTRTATVSTLIANVRRLLKLGEHDEFRLWKLPYANDAGLIQSEGRSSLYIGADSIVGLGAGGEEYDAAELVLPSAEKLQDKELDEDMRLAIEMRSSDGQWPTDVLRASRRTSAVPSRVGTPSDGPSSTAFSFAQAGPDHFARLQQAAPSRPSSTALDGPSRPATTTTAAMRVTRSKARTDRTPGLRGLVNLGNTCFMNSALQCLSNTAELQQYFESNVYKEELNPDNPLGMNGLVAEAFGSLIHELWSDTATGSIAPRKFKNTLGRFAPSFSGYQQHDSQELLAFLLDGLHEDLNRVLKKPYIEVPDWEGGGDKELVEFAKTQWEMYKKRNDSVIVDLFQGQYRSTLVCPECQKVSIKFDPYLFVSLPIPLTKKWSHEIRWVPYDVNEPRRQVRIEMPVTATIAQMKKKLGRFFGVDGKKIAVADVYNQKVYNWYNDFVPVTEIGSHDVAYAFELPVEYTPAARPKKTKFKAKASSRVFTFGGIGKASEPSDDEDDVPDEDVSLLPVFHAHASPQTKHGKASSHLFGHPFVVALTREQACSASAIYDAVAYRYRSVVSDPDGLLVDGNAQPSPTPPEPETEDEEMVSVSGAMEERDDTWEHVAAEDGEASASASASASEPRQSRPASAAGNDEDAAMEEVTKPTTDASAAAAAATEGSQALPHGRRSLFRLKAHRDEAGRLPTSMGNYNNDVFEICDSEDDAHVEPRNDSTATDDAQAAAAAAAAAAAGVDVPSAEASASAPAPPPPVSAAAAAAAAARPRKRLVRTGDSIVAEWPPSAYRFFFGGSESKSKSKDVWDDGSFAEFVDPDVAKALADKASGKKARTITIDDCIDEFTREEQLGEDDLWYCPSCKKHQQATKKLDLWSTPDILVFHLKRFATGRGIRDKLDVMVDFPIEGLNLEERVQDRKVARTVALGSGSGEVEGPPEEDAPIYDLFAVDNHYGGLGGGHYTATAMNPVDRKWYYYDDSSISGPRDPESVKTPAAYLLFYRRRTTRPIGGKTKEKVAAARERMEATMVATDDVARAGDEMASGPSAAAAGLSPSSDPSKSFTNAFPSSSSSRAITAFDGGVDDLSQPSAFHSNDWPMTVAPYPPASSVHSDSNTIGSDRAEGGDSMPPSPIDAESDDDNDDELRADNDDPVTASRAARGRGRAMPASGVAAMDTNQSDDDADPFGDQNAAEAGTEKKKGKDVQGETGPDVVVIGSPGRDGGAIGEDERSS